MLSGSFPPAPPTNRTPPPPTCFPSAPLCQRVGFASADLFRFRLLHKALLLVRTYVLFLQARLIRATSRLIQQSNVVTVIGFPLDRRGETCTKFPTTNTRRGTCTMLRRLLLSIRGSAVGRRATNLLAHYFQLGSFYVPSC